MLYDAGSLNNTNRTDLMQKFFITDRPTDTSRPV